MGTTSSSLCPPCADLTEGKVRLPDSSSPDTIEMQDTEDAQRKRREVSVLTSKNLQSVPRSNVPLESDNRELWQFFTGKLEKLPLTNVWRSHKARVFLYDGTKIVDLGDGNVTEIIEEHKREIVALDARLIMAANTSIPTKRQYLDPTYMVAVVFKFKDPEFYAPWMFEQLPPDDPATIQRYGAVNFFAISATEDINMGFFDEYNEKGLCRQIAIDLMRHYSRHTSPVGFLDKWCKAACADMLDQKEDKLSPALRDQPLAEFLQPFESTDSKGKSRPSLNWKDLPARSQMFKVVCQARQQGFAHLRELLANTSTAEAAAEVAWGLAAFFGELESDEDTEASSIKEFVAQWHPAFAANHQGDPFVRAQQLLGLSACNRIRNSENGTVLRSLSDFRAMQVAAKDGSIVSGDVQFLLVLVCYLFIKF